jgi:hypothetical protein
MNGAQKYNLDQIRGQINKELLNEKMPERVYESVNNISRIINAILKTKGEGWATQVVNNEGTPILSEQEQQQFTEAFQPFLDSILDFFDTNNKSEGGAYLPDVSKISGMSKDFLKTKAEQATHSFPKPPFDPTKMAGIDDIYTKMYNRLGNVNSVVNEYASKYGVLKLEKEHDLEEDIRLIPPPAAMAISSGVFALLKVPPTITQEVLSKVKVPFRIIVFTLYLALDIARVAVGIVGPASSRKIMSILLAGVELLKGDWKKSLLTMIGYFGMVPMLVGELLKVFLTFFRMFAPQIQHSIIFGSLDASKSLLVGLLLSIFQVTAPEEIRLPLIGSLEKIAQHKAQMDGTLESIGLSARPEYLSPTWDDLNNIQAVMSDEAYICSCEFKQLVEAVNKSAIIRIVLQILRIPVNEDMIIYKCGKEPCSDFVTTVVKEAKERTEEEKKAQEPFSMKDLELPVDLNPLKSITAPINTINDTIQSATNHISSNTIESALTNKLLSKEESKNESNDEVKEVNEEPTEVKEDVKNETREIKVANNNNNIIKGGRILHSRRRVLP